MSRVFSPNNNDGYLRGKSLIGIEVVNAITNCAMAENAKKGNIYLSHMETVKQLMNAANQNVDYYEQCKAYNTLSDTEDGARFISILLALTGVFNPAAGKDLSDEERAGARDLGATILDRIQKGGNDE